VDGALIEGAEESNTFVCGAVSGSAVSRSVVENDVLRLFGDLDKGIVHSSLSLTEVNHVKRVGSSARSNIGASNKLGGRSGLLGYPGDNGVSGTATSVVLSVAVAAKILDL
jgi:hypothetical protein